MLVDENSSTNLVAIDVAHFHLVVLRASRSFSVSYYAEQEAKLLERGIASVLHYDAQRKEWLILAFEGSGPFTNQKCPRNFEIEKNILLNPRLTAGEIRGNKDQDREVFYLFCRALNNLLCRQFCKAFQSTQASDSVFVPSISCSNARYPDRSPLFELGFRTFLVGPGTIMCSLSLQGTKYVRPTKTALRAGDSLVLLPSRKDATYICQGYLQLDIVNFLSCISGVPLKSDAILVSVKHEDSITSAVWPLELCLQLKELSESRQTVGGLPSAESQSATQTDFSRQDRAETDIELAHDFLQSYGHDNSVNTIYPTPPTAEFNTYNSFSTSPKTFTSNSPGHNTARTPPGDTPKQEEYSKPTEPSQHEGPYPARGKTESRHAVKPVRKAEDDYEITDADFSFFDDPPDHETPHLQDDNTGDHIKHETANDDLRTPPASPPSTIDDDMPPVKRKLSGSFIPDQWRRIALPAELDLKYSRGGLFYPGVSAASETATSSSGSLGPSDEMSDEDMSQDDVEEGEVPDTSLEQIVSSKLPRYTGWDRVYQEEPETKLEGIYEVLLALPAVLCHNAKGNASKVFEAKAVSALTLAKSEDSHYSNTTDPSACVEKRLHHALYQDFAAHILRNTFGDNAKVQPLGAFGSRESCPQKEYRFKPTPVKTTIVDTPWLNTNRTLARLDPPRIIARRNALVLDCSVSVFDFWSRFNLTPLKGPADVHYAIIPLSAGCFTALQFTTAFDELSYQYTNCGLGRHDRMPALSDSHGVIGKKDTESRCSEKAFAALEMMGRLCSEYEGARKVVLYVLYSSNDSHSLSQFVQKFQEIGNLASGCVLQALSTTFINKGSYGTIASPLDMMKLALSIYSRVKPTAGQSSQGSGKVIEPAFGLVKKVPPTIDFTHRLPAAFSPVKCDVNLHMAYAIDETRNLISWSWLEENFELSGIEASEFHGLDTFRIVLNRLQAETAKYRTSKKVQWNLFISKDGPMYQEEVPQWRSLLENTDYADSQDHWITRFELMATEIQAVPEVIPDLKTSKSEYERLWSNLENPFEEPASTVATADIGTPGSASTPKPMTPTEEDGTRKVFDSRFNYLMGYLRQGMQIGRLADNVQISRASGYLISQHQLASRENTSFMVHSMLSSEKDTSYFYDMVMMQLHGFIIMNNLLGVSRNKCDIPWHIAMCKEQLLNIRSWDNQ